MIWHTEALLRHEVSEGSTHPNAKTRRGALPPIAEKVGYHEPPSFEPQHCSYLSAWDIHCILSQLEGKRVNARAQQGVRVSGCDCYNSVYIRLKKRCHLKSCSHELWDQKELWVELY